MSKKNTLERVKVFVVTQDIRKPDKYNLYPIEIVRDYSTGRIKHGTIQRKSWIKENDSYENVSNAIIHAVSDGWIPDIVLTPIENMIKLPKLQSTQYQRLGGYDENKMVLDYLEIVRNIKTKTVGIVVQERESKAFHIDTGMKLNKYVINHHNIKPVTYSFMIAIQAVKKRVFSDLLRALEEE